VQEWQEWQEWQEKQEQVRLLLRPDGVNVNQVILLISIDVPRLLG